MIFTGYIHLCGAIDQSVAKLTNFERYSIFNLDIAFNIYYLKALWDHQMSPKCKLLMCHFVLFTKQDCNPTDIK